MLKTMDIISISLILMIIAFVWTYFLVKNIWLAIGISLAFYLLVWSFSKILNNKNKIKYTSQKLNKHFALMGSSYYSQIIFDNIENANKILVDEKYIILNDKVKTLIYPLYKFTSIGYENIAQIYQIANKTKCDKVYVLSGSIDKQAILLLNSLNISFEYVSIDYIFNNLKKKNALPKLEELQTKPINRINIKAVVKRVLSQNNTKYYVFSGILFALISFITINKSYYVILSTISLLLAIFTILPQSQNIFIENFNETTAKTDFDKKYLKYTYDDKDTNAEGKQTKEKNTK